MIRALLFLFLASQNPSPEALQHMQAGADAEKSRHFEMAIAEFRKVTELQPTVAAGFVSLGQAYLENHDFGGAIPPLKQALKLNPELVPAHRLLGYALLAQGYVQEALPHLEKAQDSAALGIAQLEAGQLRASVSNLEDAVAKHPNDPDLLYYFGRASGLLSKQSMDSLLAAYPDSARAHQAMAENYYVLRQMPQAEKEFQKAIQMRPDMPQLHLELGLVYAGNSQWQKAEDAFRAESKLQPGNAEAAYRLGNALLQQGKVVEAREQFVRADALQPDMPETLYSLGKAASLSGDNVAAQKAWSKVIRIEKQSDLAAKAHFALSTLYRKQGKVAEAEREMEEFKKLQQVEAPARDSEN